MSQFLVTEGARTCAPWGQKYGLLCLGLDEGASLYQACSEAVVDACHKSTNAGVDALPPQEMGITIQTTETWEGRAIGSCAEPGRLGSVYLLHLPGGMAQKGGPVAKASSSQSKD